MLSAENVANSVGERHQKWRPEMTEENAIEMLGLLYGFKVNYIKELPSFCDRNFHVMVDQTHSNQHIDEICQDGYVLKVINLEDSKTTRVEAEHDAMRLLNTSGICCPQPVPNLQGEYHSLEKIYHKKETGIRMENDDDTHQDLDTYGEHIVRLLTFLPGKSFAEVPLTSELVYQLGHIAAKLNLALQGYKHPALAETHLFHPARIPQLGDVIDNVCPMEQRSLLHHVLRTFTEQVVPMYEHFQKGVIHCDLDKGNILVDVSSRDNSDYRISGVLDFGDMSEFYYIFEIGIILAYVIMKLPPEGSDLSDQTLAGYTSVIELIEREMKALPTIVAARLAQILILCPNTHQQDPHNAKIMESVNDAWLTLQNLWKIPAEDLQK